MPTLVMSCTCPYDCCGRCCCSCKVISAVAAAWQSTEAAAARLRPAFVLSHLYGNEGAPDGVRGVLVDLPHADARTEAEQEPEPLRHAQTPDTSEVRGRELTTNGQGGHAGSRLDEKAHEVHG